MKKIDAVLVQQLEALSLAGRPIYPHRLLCVRRDGVFYVVEDLLSGDVRYFAQARDAAAGIARMRPKLRAR